jgi:transposase InsO family protein
MTISIGRRREKRWGVIFTCFSTRAVHIELAASISTDSTILAIRKMAARRGLPYQIHTDNGTNFRGADRAMRRSLQSMLADTEMSQRVNDLGIRWTFNPPDGAHMGGVWERMARSIKTALSSTLHTLAPKEKVLFMLLSEAENIVNSRPLTHVSLGVDDVEALTSNHFLLGA